MLLLNPYRFEVAAPAAPAFRAIGAINSFATAVSTAHAPVIPAGAQIGDRAFVALFCHNDPDITLFSDPSGWTLLLQNQHLKVWTKAVASGEPGNTVTLACSGGRSNRTSAMVGVYAASTPAAAVEHDPSSGASSHAMPSVTTTGTLKRVVWIAGWDGAGSTATTITSVTGESGGDWIIDGEGNTNSSGIGFVSDDKSAAGTISGGTAAYNNTLSTVKAVVCEIA